MLLAQTRVVVVIALLPSDSGCRSQTEGKWCHIKSDLCSISLFKCLRNKVDDEHNMGNREDVTSHSCIHFQVGKH